MLSLLKEHYHVFAHAQKFERTKEITEFWLSGSLRISIYGACLKWLLPELSIPAAGQKDRRLWGREWTGG